MRSAVLSIVAAALIVPALAGADALRDPTKPTRVVPGTPAAPVATLTVSAVFVSGERRVAIVNGRRVRVGDVVAGATVTGIEAGEVRFERKGKALAVPLLNRATRD